MLSQISHYPQHICPPQIAITMTSTQNTAKENPNGWWQVSSIHISELSTNWSWYRPINNCFQYIALDVSPAQASCKWSFSVQTAQAEDVFDVDELLAEDINMGSENES